MRDPFLNKLIPLTQRWFVSSLIQNGPVVLEKMMFQICQCIFAFVIISPWKKEGSLIWTNLIPFIQRWFVPSSFEIGPSGSREEYFKNLSMYFCYFVIISPLKKAELFIWTNFNPLHPRMHCAKFGWNRPSASWGDFTNSSMYFRNVVIISSWKKNKPFIWTNMNPFHPKKICAKFGWNWPIGSGEKDFWLRRILIRKAHLSLRLRWAKKLINRTNKQTIT